MTAYTYFQNSIAGVRELNPSPEKLVKDFQDSFGRQMSGILRASKGEPR